MFTPVVDPVVVARRSAHAQRAAARPVLARADCRLEHHRLPRSEPEHRPARVAARERRRIGGADDVDSVGAILQTQGDAQVRVGADLVAHHAGGSLCRQHEMDPQAAAALGDADQGGQEAREITGQGGELVDHHDEPRQWRLPESRAVGVEVVGAGLPEDAFPTADLRLEADQGALGEPVVEIGDDAHGVRQVSTGVERRPALVVDEHERHVVGAALRRQGHHQRAQQLALARSRRAGDEGVWSVADEVDLHDPFAGHADRRPWVARPGAITVTRVARPPRSGDGDRVVELGETGPAAHP